jgi:hypothetical protein
VTYAEDPTISEWGNFFGDGQWHTLELHVKVNSSVGANDGIGRVYWDGELQGGKTDIPYFNSGLNLASPGANSTYPVIGWNFVSLGGNSNQAWSGQSNEEAVQCDYDKIVISTTRLATDDWGL